MKKPSTLTAIAAVAVAVATLALNVSSVQAQEKKAPVMNDKATVPMNKHLDYSDRSRAKAWASDKDMLAAQLKAGASKADYMKAIANAGFTITAINADKPDYLEYEVVKGKDSYEVQIDLDKA